MNFIIQSNLQAAIARPALYDEQAKFWRPATDGAVLRLSLILLLLALIGFGIFQFMPALGLGIAFPGAGFLTGSAPFLGLGLTWLFLGAALFLWFATGNVIGPPLVWLSAALISVWAETGPAGLWPVAVFMAAPIFVLCLWGLRAVLWVRGRARFRALNRKLGEIRNPAKVICALPDFPREAELSERQMSGLKFLLDRALQPVSEFGGYEHRDHFQTASIRYQTNFLSYALSMAQRNCLPALGAYMQTAQSNLKAKQEQPISWRYWASESLWGNLEHNPDPIAKDNIMYSGFVGAQMIMAYKAAPRRPDHFMDGLRGENGDFKFEWAREPMFSRLSEQYADGRFGLLPCEPNWVYPLCNFITAAALQAHDSGFGTSFWRDIKDDFRRAMETEFLSPDGHFIPFRSAYAGLAVPQMGGLIMKTFPCFFLNGIFPDIAMRQWLVTREQLQGRSLRKACWPIDVGNYNYSRAAGYAASALAAAEMGDKDLKERLLGLMAEDCDPIIKDDRAYFRGASLWANANGFMADICRPNSFRALINSRLTQNTGPYIEAADPGEIMFASARSHDGALIFKARAENGPGFNKITVGGLRPGANYALKYQGGETGFAAQMSGAADLNIPAARLSRFMITPQQ